MALMPDRKQNVVAISTSSHIKLPSSLTSFFLPFLRALGMIQPSYLADIECPSLLYVVDWERAFVTSSKSTHEEEGPLLRKRMDALRIAELRRYKDGNTAHECVVAFMTHPELGKRYLRIERVNKPTEEENAGRLGEDYPPASTPLPAGTITASSRSIDLMVKDKKGIIASISVNDKPAVPAKRSEKPLLNGLFDEPIDPSMKYSRSLVARGNTIGSVSPNDTPLARVPSPIGASAKVQPGAKSTPLPRKSVETTAAPPLERPKAPPVNDDVSTLFNWPSDILVETLDINHSKIPLRDLAIVASLVHTHDDPYKYLENPSTWFSDFIIQVVSRASNQKVVREMNQVEGEDPDWTAEELSPGGTFVKVPVSTRRKNHIQFLFTAFEVRRGQIIQQMKDADAVVADKRSRERKLQEVKRQDTLDIPRAEEARAKAEADAAKVNAEEARLRDTMAKLEAETARLNETTAKADAAASRLKRVEGEIAKLK
ncbi:hypothetical protein BU17DRAFT_85725 [Hysterangium stoloniferum]|nr:hypothetical protein BU17DRAFT_85725 [Hysterangium stoloniferum]